MTHGAPFRAARVGGCLQATVAQRADGVQLLEATEPLGAYPERLSDCLEHWARVAPDRSFAAQRDPAEPGGGHWQHISYAQMLARAQAIGQALLDRGLSAQKPLVILSDNDLQHLSLAMGAMWAGVAYVPISPAYSLLSKDFGKLRHIVKQVTPGLVFAASAAYGPAIDAVLDPGVEVVLGEGQLQGRASTVFDDLLATTPGPGLAAAHAATNAQTVIKLLFTSGSTQNPKGVITTHRMLCSNQQMLRQAFAFLADEPPVLVDWLPWNHTFGGSHNVGIVLYNGGTLYIDQGKPTPQGMATTLRNLREISPTVYFNVPKGFEELARAMQDDAALRARLFERVRMFMYAGAGLAQAVWDQLDALALQTVGQRIAMFTGLGMTETSPSCTFALRAGQVRSGHIGLPCPGVQVKLVPEGQGPLAKTEVRFRGPNVMPGYWREPTLTAQAFDEEGYYRTGDAVRWVDAADSQQGLLFDGRMAEDFKLATGTFVSVGPLRAAIVAAGSPCVQDAVVAGLDRNEIAVLIVPRLDELARLARAAGASDAQADLRHAAQLLALPVVRHFFQALVDRLWQQGTGSANRVARLHVLEEALSIDRGELTDKGSINQRAVLHQRSALVDAIYQARSGKNSSAGVFVYTPL